MEPALFCIFYICVVLLKDARSVFAETRASIKSAIYFLVHLMWHNLDPDCLRPLITRLTLEHTL